MFKKYIFETRNKCKSKGMPESGELEKADS